MAKIAVIYYSSTGNVHQLAGALAALGLIATSLALSWFNAVADDPAVLTEILVIGLVTATIGTLRFIALRWVFRPRPV